MKKKPNKNLKSKFKLAPNLQIYFPDMDTFMRKKFYILILSLMVFAAHNAVADRALLASHTSAPSDFISCVSSDGLNAKFGIWQDSGDAQLSFNNGFSFLSPQVQCSASFLLVKSGIYQCFSVGEDQVFLTRQAAQSIKSGRIPTNFNFWLNLNQNQNQNPNEYAGLIYKYTCARYSKKN
jgi:hypothetical protein